MNGGLLPTTPPTQEPTTTFTASIQRKPMPQKPKHPCPTCGRLTRTICCGQARNTNEWRELARTIIHNHIRQHGNTCPGVHELDHPPHLSNRLTVDHINGNPTDHRLENLRVVCYLANTLLYNQSAPLYNKTHPSQ